MRLARAPSAKKHHPTSCKRKPETMHESSSMLLELDAMPREHSARALLDRIKPPPRAESPTKLILHGCADTGSDTWAYQQDPAYTVSKIGAGVGIENFSPARPVHGAVMNPVCIEFSPVRRGKPGTNYPHVSDPEAGLFLVRECLRVIEEAQPKWWVIENPAMGSLRKFLGKPTFTYQPWQYGSPWTKLTALWGEFTPPEPTYKRWEDVPKLDLWARAGRKPSIVYLHKSAFHMIPEFRDSGMPAPESDMELRSLCSQGFARAFKEVNP